MYSIDLNQKIIADYSLQFLVDVLNSSDDKFRAHFSKNEDRLHKFEAITLQGGLLSTIFRLDFYFNSKEDQSNEPDFKVVFKVATTSKIEALGDQKEIPAEDLLPLKEFVFGAHNSEVTFYENIPSLMNAQANYFPLFYCGKKAPDVHSLDKGYLVIQYLEHTLQADIGHGLSKAQVESAIKTIAKLQAISLSFSEELMAQFTFAKIGKFKDEEVHLSEKLFKLPVDYFRNNKEEVSDFVQSNCEMKRDVHTKLGIRPVLSHGDFWANNIFFHENDVSTVKAVIDWQCVHPNTGLNDVLRLIYTGVNTDLRRSCQAGWIKLYFETVQAEAKKHNIQPEVSYNQQTIEQIYKEQTGFETIFASLLLVTLADELSGSNKQNVVQRMVGLFEDCQRNTYFN